MKHDDLKGKVGKVGKAGEGTTVSAGQVSSGHISSARRLKSPVLGDTGALAWDTSPDQPEDEGILGTSSLPPLRSLAFPNSEN